MVRVSKPKMNRKLKKLWDSLDKAQRDRFAKLVGREHGSMLQTVYGRRGISSALAIKIEKAASRMRIEISRTDLNETCAGCEFARACLKGVV